MDFLGTHVLIMKDNFGVSEYFYLQLYLIHLYTVTKRMVFLS